MFVFFSNMATILHSQISIIQRKIIFKRNHLVLHNFQQVAEKRVVFHSSMPGYVFERVKNDHLMWDFYEGHV